MATKRQRATLAAPTRPVAGPPRLVSPPASGTAPVTPQPAPNLAAAPVAPRPAPNLAAAPVTPQPAPSLDAEVAAIIAEYEQCRGEINLYNTRIDQTVVGYLTVVISALAVLFTSENDIAKRIFDLDRLANSQSYQLVLFAIAVVHPILLLMVSAWHLEILRLAKFTSVYLSSRMQALAAMPRPFSSDATRYLESNEVIIWRGAIAFIIYLFVLIVDGAAVHFFVLTSTLPKPLTPILTGVAVLVNVIAFLAPARIAAMGMFLADDTRTVGNGPTDAAAPIRYATVSAARRAKYAGLAIGMVALTVVVTAIWLAFLRR